jgi:uncharacterized protein YbjT (DUF2867 family)
VRYGVKHVVAVSTLGRGIASPPGTFDAGPINSSLAKDEAIGRTGTNFRALWCPGFMENMLRQVATLKSEGVFYSPARGDRKLPQVSTRDIASSAARLLLDPSWRGQGGIAVLGPEDLSNNDMAAIMSEVLGRPIRYQFVPAETYKAQLIKFGATAAVAQAMMRMFAAKDDGLDNAEPRTQENTSPTSFRQWCEEVLKPAMQSD